jgi:hypothetical protein
VELNVAAHEVDEAPGDGEAEAGAAEAAGGGAIGLNELLKDALLEIGRHAGSSVGDREGERGPVFGVVEIDGDRDLADASELDGVAHQIDENLLETDGIAVNPFRGVGPDGPLPVEILLAGERSEDAIDLGEHGGEMNGEPFDGHAAGFDLRRVEQVVQDGELQFGGTPDGFDVGLLLGGEGRGDEQVEGAEDAIHGRADFVADVSEELRLGAVGQFGGGAGAAHAAGEIDEGQHERGEDANDAQHEGIAAARFAELRHDQLFRAREQKPAVGGAADGAVVELILNAFPKALRGRLGFARGGGGEHLHGVGYDVDAERDVGAIRRPVQQKRFEQAGFNEAGFRVTPAQSGQGGGSVRMRDLRRAGIAKRCLSAHEGQIRDADAGAGPIRFVGRAVDDGVVVLQPGLAHLHTPFVPGADRDQGPEVDLLRLESDLGTLGERDPFQAKAFAAGRFREDIDRVSLWPNAGDPEVIRGRAVDADAVDALIGRRNQAATAKQNEWSEEDRAQPDATTATRLAHTDASSVVGWRT